MYNSNDNMKYKILNKISNLLKKKTVTRCPGNIITGDTRTNKWNLYDRHTDGAD